jgi:hypothetical protein
MTETYWPDYYMTSGREDNPNWQWVKLWEQENLNPYLDDDALREDFDEWLIGWNAMKNRVWVAWVLPQFHVFDWPEERVQQTRELLRGLVCGVCGRVEDPGCVRGC